MIHGKARGKICISALLMTTLVVVSSGNLEAAPAERELVILDTDIGTGIDDGFALALILGSTELELRGITTVSGNTQQRALLACRFLTMTGRRHTPVAAGADPQPARDFDGQYQYYYHPDVLFNRTSRPVKETAVEFLYARLKAQPGKITLLAAGPLTNIARLLQDKPECKPWIKRIVVVGGLVEGKPVKDDNIALDLKAAQTVFASGVPLFVVPLDATKDLTLDETQLTRLFSPGTALSNQARALYQLWDQKSPPLAAVLAAALCFEERFAEFKEMRLEVGEKGTFEVKPGKANARVAVSCNRQKFLSWYIERMAGLKTPAQTPAKLVERGAMPSRVHVWEDFETDIERRWWMSGKAEKTNLSPGSTRACRGVLTHDFDDLLGNPKAMYTAVIFNPVPGPVMGPNTRLGFKYWLKGTGSLRVQIYSLTNGYHRHLVLNDLPQEKWQSATVDMTQCRRPDGTGGPLSEGERIDDIQFYTDPTAELIIDDIVLFDAAAADEKRPFPTRVHFTGLFDTGAQGKEWPGTFEIIEHKPPLSGKAARSVANEELGAPWLRLHLRGERPLGEKTQLSFRYRLSGADNLRVQLRNCTSGDAHLVELKNLRKDEWATGQVDFSTIKGVKGGEMIRSGDRVDEIHFLLPRGAELLVDDVLLYER
jgi:inosine-uridine nucleoside N-ribohydrolase